MSQDFSFLSTKINDSFSWLMRALSLINFLSHGAALAEEEIVWGKADEAQVKDALIKSSIGCGHISLFSSDLLFTSFIASKAQAHHCINLE